MAGEAEADGVKLGGVFFAVSASRRAGLRAAVEVTRLARNAIIESGGSHLAVAGLGAQPLSGDPRKKGLRRLGVRRCGLPIFEAGARREAQRRGWAETDIGWIEDAGSRPNR